METSIVYFFFICFVRADNFINFNLKAFCDVISKQDTGCVQEVTHSEKLGNLRCAAWCGASDTCVGALVSSQSCFTVDSSCAPLDGTCGPNDMDFEYFEKESQSASSQSASPCLNGGVFDSSTSSCRCVGGWIGTTCERLGTTCQQLYDDGYPRDRYLVTLDPYGDGSVVYPEVDCQVKSGSQLYIFHSTGSGYHSNRSWDDLLNGYRIDNSDFWLGLEKFYHFTAAGNDEVKITITFEEEGGPMTTLVFVYFGFSLGDESTGFTFNYASTTNAYPTALNLTQGECLAESKGLRFTAALGDFPNGGSAAFASLSGRSWWFPENPGDVTCSPLGWSPQYSRPTTEEYMILTDVDVLKFVNDLEFLKVYMSFKH